MGDKGRDDMKVTDEALLRSGFTQPELQKIKSNIEKYGGTPGEAINDLARRFVTLAGVVAVCTFTLLYFSSSAHLIEQLHGGWR
mgnify:CR=1 FL=1